MSIFRFIAPSGTQIRLSDLLHWLGDLLLGRDRRDELRQRIKQKFSVRHCFLMSSGRAAMAMLFSMLKEENSDAARTEIVMPSYTCYSVPAAAEIAGLNVRICDIKKSSLSYDAELLQQIDFSKVLAIVSANLYGNPDDLQLIEKIAMDNDIIMIDDAAQSMNARIAYRYAGSFGHIGLYSLDKGKNITSIQGGVIVTNDNALAQSIDKKISQLSQMGLAFKISEAIKLFAYSIMLRPWLYWIPNKITALGLGKTIYTTDYLFSHYSAHLASISCRLFDRLDKITQERCENALAIKRLLSDVSDITMPISSPNSLSSCLRLPLLFKSKQQRDQVLQQLSDIGIGATASYPKSIADLDELRDFSRIEQDQKENGRHVAEHILTLPTHSFISNHDIYLISRTIHNICS